MRRQETRDITDLIGAYRLVCTSVWNTHVRPHYDVTEYVTDDDWDAMDAFDDACCSLFGSIVLRPLGVPQNFKLPTYSSRQVPVQCIKVVTAKDIHVPTRQDRFDDYQRFPAPTDANGIDLRFVDFWQADVWGTWKWDDVLVLIDAWEGHDGLVGRKALVSADDATFLYEAGVQQPPRRR